MRRNSGSAWTLTLALASAALSGCEDASAPLEPPDGLEPWFAGTGGLAIPTGLCEDASGHFVGIVSVQITAGWLSAPHSVRVRITSDNLVIDEPHGEEVHALADLQVNGSIDGGDAEVIIGWSSDTNPTSPEHVYEVSANIIFADKHEGTRGAFRFSDCI